MAKFNSSHLKLKTDQRADFGDSDQSWFSYTTTSGQGLDLTTNVPIAGEQAVESYHLVRYDQLTTMSGFLSVHANLTGLSSDDHPQYVLVDGSRGFTSTVSGVTPIQDSDLATKEYIDDAITGISGGNFDHGLLTGLDSDDHTQYTLADGTRAFTGTVSGIDPTVDEHLTTKSYVDDAITTATGSLTSDHGDLTGLSDDDHPQYILVDGTRAFTGTVSGVAPTEDDHIATKYYVDTQLSTVSGTKKWGRISVINTAVSQAVTFDADFADDDYTLVATLTNQVDSPPSIYSTIQGVKAAGGFTTHFSGEIDSANFILEWIAFYGQQS